MTIASRELKARCSSSGFTLIELMIVVMVIGVLAAIAYPAYQQHVIKTRRAAAAGCALEAAQFMERFYTTNLKYVDGSNNAPALPVCSTDLNGHYALAVTGASASAYIINITPVAGSVQALKDTLCGKLTINQAGVKGESGVATSAAECW